MTVISIPKSLRDKLGEDASDGLVQFVNEATKEGRDNLILLAEERYEKRLTEEVGKLDNKLDKRISEEVAKLDKRISEEVAKLRIDMAIFKSEIIKWMFLFWIGQLVVIAGLLKFIK